MNRTEAMDILRELVTNDLVEPSHVSISERNPSDYQLQIRTKYNRTQLDDYIKKKGLALQEDSQEKYLLVYKP